MQLRWKGVSSQPNAFTHSVAPDRKLNSRKSQTGQRPDLPRVRDSGAAEWLLLEDKVNAVGSRHKGSKVFPLRGSQDYYD